jgi:hypothetical protein
VNGKFIGSCDIVRDLHQRGELPRIVEEAEAPYGRFLGLVAGASRGCQLASRVRSSDHT